MSALQKNMRVNEFSCRTLSRMRISRCQFSGMDIATMALVGREEARRSSSEIFCCESACEAFRSAAKCSVSNMLWNPHERMARVHCGPPMVKIEDLWLTS